MPNYPHPPVDSQWVSRTLPPIQATVVRTERTAGGKVYVIWRPDPYVSANWFDNPPIFPPRTRFDWDAHLGYTMISGWHTLFTPSIDQAS